MNNLQPLKWGSQNHARSAFHEYLIRKDGEARKNSNSQYEVVYGRLNTQQSYDVATGFATIDEAKEWCWNHYNEKMQPYVKPSPTKVFELTYDCGDSYATLFMTTDKQSAIDFMESVKDADRDFISSYGFDDDADELLVKQYDDNHPLKPYAREIFESIYEDSFSEWAMSYAGSSLVSQMSIIEHELFVKQGE